MRRKNLVQVLQEFSVAMNYRLLDKKAEGFDGWDDKKKYPNEEFIKRVGDKLINLRINPTKKDCVDIANYMMFIFNRIK